MEITNKTIESGVVELEKKSLIEELVDNSIEDNTNENIY